MSYETDYSTLFCVHFYSIAPEGGRVGFGSWGVSADVTIDSEVFVMGLHTDRVGSIHFGGDKNKKKYDEIIDKNTKKSVSLEVEYSDGKQEIIK